jgi:deoxyribodipyrimidine photolyase-related protein
VSSTPCLRLILGDQLSLNLSSLRDASPEQDLILMCELAVEATYVHHHKQKLVLVFSAMRHFARQLRHQGFKVHYLTLDDPTNSGSFTPEIETILQRSGCRRVVLTEPAEFRLLDRFRHWQRQHPQWQIELREDDRFLCSAAEFRHWASGRKQLRMEYFYRQLRQRYNILMQAGQPVGGQWNFDKENRKPLPADLKIPPPPRFEPDDLTRDVMALVERHFGEHFGSLEAFNHAVTREQALEQLTHFLDCSLPCFGDYQDAMRQGEPWLHHSLLSTSINLGLLSPMEVIEAVQARWQQGQAPLNAAEGFIRQILGWREYVRGLYWLYMPEYAGRNHLQAMRPLPNFFWSGQTDLNCMRQCIEQTHDYAYAHHIQRLMVIGNFALLAGLEPSQVGRWYLEVYADAYEWVELPNVLGMVLFADGGTMASKPYAASGAYINRMSDYCRHCRYDVQQKSGPKACPFNYLYWDFMQRNEGQLRGNPRLGLTYRQLDKMKPEQRQSLQDSARIFLEALEESD